FRAYAWISRHHCHGVKSSLRRQLVAARPHYRLRTFLRAHNCRLCESRCRSQTRPARFCRRIKDTARPRCHPTRATCVLAVIELNQLHETKDDQHETDGDTRKNKQALATMIIWLR